ncbi:MAG: hypothetical protein LBL45_09095 [Treponema sp.]|jgi:hypothetical protein|nr:hypothetical protein [Treponema sp.]
MKGSMSSLELQKIEEAKSACARKHFARTGAELVMYDKIDSYETLINKVILTPGGFKSCNILELVPKRELRSG